MKPLRDDEPREIGPYRVLAELGEGGMGRVLLAAAGDGQLVALKVMRPHLLHDAQFRYRFRREVITSREVAASRWTAAVLGSDEHAPEPWLASEFFHGPTLAEALIANGPLGEASTRRLMHGLAAALAEIHSYGVVHRDLKPSNVILTDDGVRLIDFGIARVTEEAGGEASITQTGALIGAPAYMSPEQVARQAIGPASDLFSLGTTVITAGTGANPFDAEALYEIMNRVVNGDPGLERLPEALRYLVEPCMRKQPEQRVSAAELVLRIGEPLAAPWPPAVAALEQRQRAEVADLARRHGWDTLVRPDRTVVMFGPGVVPAQVQSGPPETTISYSPEPPYMSAPQGYSPVPTVSPGYAPVNPGYAPAPPGGPVLPPGGPYLPQQGPKQDRTVLYAVLAVLAVVVIALIVVLPNLGGDGGEDPELTLSDGASSDGAADDAGLGGEETDPVETETDPVAAAVVGDCFWDYGDETTADLEPSYCEDGSFEVVEVFEGTTDLSSCDAVDDVTTSVSSSAGDLVLCLSYLHPNGEAYHAEVGECVFGPNDSVSQWYPIDCQEGAFEVLERLEGVSDPASCAGSVYYNQNYTFTTSQSYLDVVLCLSMIYPDDMGYATQDDCMSMSGDPDAGTALFTFADCDSANTYVTGRVDEYENLDWCGDDGWSTWMSTDFPEHAYTVCWRYL
ncbi:serine/threonine-protein kinase [Glycomyces luteolus]|uniref:Serine/threonine-protein kinase n=1 Tax=Glycomyces luteolus TaxID=2670330 RepID=A0A9X3STZ0_9ACTN|nr:serine/threonine-protein kinase [Glycomyces luteolus]MDA1362864.1 serine/threonine-protein kinase [Glycomyces luteolus]